LRILLLSWEYPPHVVGGLGKHVADLVPVLAAQGMEVHIVTPELRGGAVEEVICPGATVHRVPLPTTMVEGQSIVAFSQASNTSLERRARELHFLLGGFHLIHGHDWLVAYSSVALKYALKLPLIVTVHSMEHGRMQGNLSNEQSLAINGTEWWLTYEAWRVITVSHYMARQVHDLFSVPRDKLDIIPNGVMLPQAAPLERAERDALRRQYAADQEKIVYYVGRVVHEKGIHILIDAAPQIVRTFPHVKFVIAGTGTLLDALRQRAVDRGVSQSFIFTGFISDDLRDKLYQIADVAVFPSLYEPFGIVALEAMAYGCPVVAAHTGGLAEFIKPHETGILTHPGDPGSLAWGILHTLQQPEWATIRAANALHEVQQIYNWERIAAQTIESYRQTYEGWLHSPWSNRHAAHSSER